MNLRRNYHSLTHSRLRRDEYPHDERTKPRSTHYGLALVLAGITADDYLQWIRDPDPTPATGLTLISAQAAPPGDRIELELLAQGEPPSHRAAAIAVGFPITPEVIGSHRIALPAPTKGDAEGARHR